MPFLCPLMAVRKLCLQSLLLHPPSLLPCRPPSPSLLSSSIPVRDYPTVWSYLFSTSNAILSRYAGRQAGRQAGGQAAGRAGREASKQAGRWAGGQVV